LVVDPAQEPAAQLLLWHWSLAVHVIPFVTCDTHAPPEQ
jgi:hypothetical protein